MPNKNDTKTASHHYHLVIRCPDRCGIVAAVSGFIAEHHGSILQADQHCENNWFFMRYEIDAATLRLSVDTFPRAFKKIAEKFQMHYRITHTIERQRVVILVSRNGHCLEELLYRWHNQELNAEIVGVISNHADLSPRVEYFHLPFYHVPIHQNNKTVHFQKIEAIITSLQVDLIVLARYMQVLPNSWCHKWGGKIINIHHSFLPSFVGAHPYQQAAERGVKLIGATAHYVTPELDQGPIIEQNVIRVNHKHTLNDFVRLGKNVERLVLADAVNAHLENRVTIHGNKTIVFN